MIQEQQATEPSKKLMVRLMIGAAVAIFLACGGGFYFIVKTSRAEGLPLVGCQAKMDAAKYALLAYAEAHEGKLPNAATWQDDIRPYIKESLKKSLQNHADAQVSMDDEVWSCVFPTADRTSGIAFNSDLSGALLKEIKKPKETALVFEVPEPRHNAAVPYTKQTPESAPRLMGQMRHWMEAPIEGDILFKVVEGKEPLNL